MNPFDTITTDSAISFRRLSRRVVLQASASGIEGFSDRGVELSFCPMAYHHFVTGHRYSDVNAKWIAATIGLRARGIDYDIASCDVIETIAETCGASANLPLVAFVQGDIR